MPMSKPEIILRLGSHAEKEYFLKTSSLYDGVIIGANLLESTPGATSSLLLKIKKLEKKIYIDPITYSFGLDTKKYLQTTRYSKKTKTTKTEIKKSFSRLSVAYGDPFKTAIESKSEVSLGDFTDSSIPTVAKAIGNYQLNRIKSEFETDEELKDFSSEAPRPAAIFAPYLYCPDTGWDKVLNTNVSLMKSTVSQFGAEKVHGVICAHRQLLSDESFVAALLAGIAESKVAGVWLWFSKFYETKVSKDELGKLRNLVQKLSKTVSVYNLHGGCFSLCLSKYGMAGISHGVGYGEQKDVIPVLGASLPTVRYHMPALHQRYGVPEIERSFNGLGIKTTDEFYEKICACTVCKGVIGADLKNFGQFDDRYIPEDSESDKDYQTPASAKRCRYHFLFARDTERKLIAKNNVPELLNWLKNSKTNHSVAGLSLDLQHLDKWIAALT